MNVIESQTSERRNGKNILPSSRQFIAHSRLHIAHVYIEYNLSLVCSE